jgi:hypothetical protein
MTVVQIFALIGVFLIGVVAGGYAAYKFIVFATKRCVVLNIGLVNCGCGERHLAMHVRNPVPSLGSYDLTLEVDPGLADKLEALKKSS